MAQKLLVHGACAVCPVDTLVRTETIAQNVIKIGRDQKSHLRIDDDSVSRMHAVIEAKPDEVQVIDLVSSTYVNGQQVNKCGLKSGDEIRLGNTRLIVELGQPVEKHRARIMQKLKVSSTAELIRLASRAMLVESSNQGPPERFSPRNVFTFLPSM